MQHKALTDIKTNESLTSLHAAAVFGHKAIVEQLLQSGASILSLDAHSWTPLHLAAFKGWTDLIKPLFKENLRTSTFLTSLHLAAYSGNKETVQVLLELESKVIDCIDVFGCTALYIAAFQGNVNVVEILIKGNKLLYYI